MFDSLTATRNHSRMGHPHRSLAGDCVPNTLCSPPGVGCERRFAGVPQRASLIERSDQRSTGAKSREHLLRLVRAGAVQARSPQAEAVSSCPAATIAGSTRPIVRGNTPPASTACTNPVACPSRTLSGKALENQTHTAPDGG
jgi:hypothetical protein